MENDPSALGGEATRRGQDSVEQIITIRKQWENGRPAKELCRQYGFSPVLDGSPEDPLNPTICAGPTSECT